MVVNGATVFVPLTKIIFLFSQSSLTSQKSLSVFFKSNLGLDDKMVIVLTIALDYLMTGPFHNLAGLLT